VTTTKTIASTLACIYGETRGLAKNKRVLSITVSLPIISDNPSLVKSFTLKVGDVDHNYNCYNFVLPISTGRTVVSNTIMNTDGTVMAIPKVFAGNLNSTTQRFYPTIL
jgi:hypothetical protein